MGNFWLRRTSKDCTPPVLCRIETQYKVHYKEDTLLPRPCMLTACNGRMTASQLTGLHMHHAACLCMSVEDTATSITHCTTHRRFLGRAIKALERSILSCGERADHISRWSTSSSQLEASIDGSVIFEIFQVSSKHRGQILTPGASPSKLQTITANEPFWSVEQVHRNQVK